MEFQLKRFHMAIEVTKIANIHYFEFTNQYHTFMDRHAFRELVYVDSGSITVESESYTGILKMNELIIHKTNEIHSLSCPTDDAPSVIIIGFECASEMLDSFSSQPTMLSQAQQKILTEIIKEGRSVFLPPYDVPNVKNMKKRKDYPFGADQMIKIKLEEFFIMLLRSKTVSQQLKNDKIANANMLEICTYIEKNYKGKINLNELCFLYNTNKTSLCYGFKAAFGETIIHYINRLRIKEAKKLLRASSLNITQIAAEVGFSSVYYFSRIFKSLENKSPTEYIKTIKSKLDSFE